MNLEIRFIPRREYRRVRSASMPAADKLEILADMSRANALATVKRAGSGHLGSSFSSLDVVTFLYFADMNIADVGIGSPERDIYFSSKGHDVPGHYAVLYGLGIVPEERFVNLRRLGGTHGHPDLKVPGIEANSGSLGMGISKAKGMAMAKRFGGRRGRVIVMTGDGELQEGQIWESLQTTAHQGVTNVTVVVDNNRIQSDTPVAEILGLGDLETKFRAFGWAVERCDGHDFDALEAAFQKFRRIEDRPKVLIADTIKGRGVSFMEGPRALEDGNGLYRWHAGAPDDDAYEAGFSELTGRIDRRLEEAGLGRLETTLIETREKGRVRLKDTAEKVVTAYGQALVELGRKHADLVVLDADLSADCGLREFEYALPERFIENGIAEQDMVSTAGGLALQGMLPVVNSFGVFLASRANEQIYNNATEHSRIIYVCHYAGLIPAGPGKSHQSLRDISLFGALPNFVIMEPANALETRQAIKWCVEEADGSCMMRLVISPSPRTIELPADYTFTPGRGCCLHPGADAALIAYGPVMLNEALVAAETLAQSDIGLKIINLPWLNRCDRRWLAESLAGIDRVFVLDNHAPAGGLGDFLLDVCSRAEDLRAKRLEKFAVEGDPACGTPTEALKFHRLDGESLADRIRAALRRADQR